MARADRRAVTQRLRVEVAVERDAEPIRGTLEDGVGGPIEFTGWLELMSAFDSARARAIAAPDPPPAAD
jgi:hypothetical protein